MRSTRPALGLGLGSIALLALTFLLADLSAAQTPKRGGTLRVSYGNEIAHLDFHTAGGYEMMWVAMNVGCGLVNITPDGKFVGDVAESWQMSPDGLLYTFKLRKNALFHDGTQVDAAAVKFSIDRLMDPETKSGMRPFYAPVHSVEVIDPHTVQIRLKHPYAFFLHMLAGYRTGLVIYNPVATQKYTLQDRQQGKPEAVSGCGPFRLVEWVEGKPPGDGPVRQVLCPGDALRRPRDDPRDQGPRHRDGGLQGGGDRFHRLVFPGARRYDEGAEP